MTLSPKRKIQMRACSKEWRKNNPEGAKEHSRIYRVRHLESARAWGRTNSYSSKGKFQALTGGAKKRKLTLDLTYDQYLEIVIGGVCCYCDSPLPKAGHGIDRKNSTLGYSKSNCSPCCTVCNRIRGKDDISHEEMFEVAKLLQRLHANKTR
jgi:hypothetical protein